jgi:hypothetical protein
VYFSAHQICLRHLLKSVPSLCIFLVLLQLTMLTSFSRTFVANSSRFLSIFPQHSPTRFVVYMSQFFCLLAGLIVDMGKSFFLLFIQISPSVSQIIVENRWNTLCCDCHDVWPLFLWVGWNPICTNRRNAFLQSISKVQVLNSKMKNPLQEKPWFSDRSDLCLWGLVANSHVV